MEDSTKEDITDTIPEDEDAGHNISKTLLDISMTLGKVMAIYIEAEVNVST